MRTGSGFLLMLAFLCQATTFSDGQKLFEYDFSQPLQTAPAVDLDGTIFVGGKGAVAAVTPAGTEIWKSELSVGSQADIGAITIGANEIYVTSTEGLFAFSKTGSNSWSLPINCGSSAVALSLSGDLFVGDS